MTHNTQERRRGRSTPLSDLDPALTESSRRLIGCAIEVHKELGPGYPVEIYKKALIKELEIEEVAHTTDHKVDVEFDEEVIGTVHADFFIEERFLLNIIAEYNDVSGGDRNALRATLRAADLELGLIINFGQRRLKDGLVRVLNPDALRKDDEGDDDEYEDDNDD
ncbi:MAG: GxxExxY protein [Phycisphaerales bacterium]|jgi:GxxExxY protein|nr:GxxExxY protein [Phycisphaerales bacterium]